MVNYKTEQLTRICLNSIRANTKPDEYELIVVDNNSADSSLEYLRSLNWIKLIERKNDVEEGGSRSQGTALDIALKNASGEFFLAMHSDAFVRSPDWLDFLKKKITEADYASAGTGKLEITNPIIKLLRDLFDIKKIIRKISDKKKEIFYIRAICAIYKTEVLLKENLSFAKNTDIGVTCAKQLYLDLIEKGYKCNVIQTHEMLKYIFHLGHATMALNPEFKVRNKTKKKYIKQLEKILNMPEIKKILELKD
ncbi:MAG TPA: glycosyltransferase family A protein [Victivallales bacterium]|nr:glycosyltransferase family A protein [Victivallales bacterium]